MKLVFTNKFLKQVSKINNKKLAKEIQSVIESAELANSLSGLKI